MQITVEANTPFGAVITPGQSNQSLNDVSVSIMRDLFDEYRFLLFRGFKSFDSKSSFEQWAELWGEISLWPFGKTLELVEHEQPEDHIFDNNYVPMHWDGMYRPKVPELQIFQCVSAPGVGAGGRTTFSHTGLALDTTPAETKELWEKASIEYTRKMEYYDSKTIAPIVTKHPVSGVPVIRYCEPPSQSDSDFLNHPGFEINGLNSDERANFLTTIRDALYATGNFYAHDWQTNDVVVSDNHTMLHGREAFVSGVPRHLRRIHVMGQPNLPNPHLVYHS